MRVWRVDEKVKRQIDQERKGRNDVQYTAVLEEALKKAKEEGGSVHETIETMAVLGPYERERMFQCFR